MTAQVKNGCQLCSLNKILISNATILSPFNKENSRLGEGTYDPIPLTVESDTYYYRTTKQKLGKTLVLPEKSSLSTSNSYIEA